MFDLVTGNIRHIPQHAALPIAMSTAAQALTLTALLAIPVLFVTDQMPEIPTMMAFVASLPPPAPPPPPPAPGAAKPTPAQARSAWSDGRCRSRCGSSRSRRPEPVDR